MNGPTYPPASLLKVTRAQPTPAMNTQPPASVSAGLLPCPFCGSIFIKLNTIRDGATMACHDCMAQGPAKFAPNAREKSREAWNTRAATPSDEVREAAIEECAKIADQGLTKFSPLEIARAIRALSTTEEKKL